MNDILCKTCMLCILYLHHKLILRLAGVFGFLPMTVPLNKFAHTCYRDHFCQRHSKKHVLNQNKNKYNCLQKCWKLSLLPKFWGPPKSGALGLSLLSLIVNSRLSQTSNRLLYFCEEISSKSSLY